MILAEDVAVQAKVVPTRAARVPPRRGQRTRRRGRGRALEGVGGGLEGEGAGVAGGGEGGVGGSVDLVVVLHRKQMPITPRKVRRAYNRQPTHTALGRDVTDPTPTPWARVAHVLEFRVTRAQAWVRRVDEGWEAHEHEVGRVCGGGGRGAAEDVGFGGGEGGWGGDEFEEEFAEGELVFCDGVGAFCLGADVFADAHFGRGSDDVDSYSILLGGVYSGVDVAGVAGSERCEHDDDLARSMGRKM